MKLMRMIDQGRGGRLSEPAYARWIPWLFIMPVGVQKIVRNLSGVDTAMLGFRGQVKDTATSRGTPNEKSKSTAIIVPMLVNVFPLANHGSCNSRSLI